MFSKSSKAVFMLLESVNIYKVFLDTSVFLTMLKRTEILKMYTNWNETCKQTCKNTLEIILLQISWDF